MAFLETYGSLLLTETGKTLIMTFIPAIISYLVGIPLGVLVYVTFPGMNSIAPNKPLSTALDYGINITRSIPFIVLLVAIIPFTKLVAGTFIGVKGAIVPLTIAAIPFVARMVQGSLSELDKGVVESARLWAPPTARSSSMCCCRNPFPPWCGECPSPPSISWATLLWRVLLARADWATWPSATASTGIRGM